MASLFLPGSRRKTISTALPSVAARAETENFPVKDCIFSILSAVYRVESLVPKLIRRLRKVLLPSGRRFEILLAEDTKGHTESGEFCPSGPPRELAWVRVEP